MQYDVAVLGLGGMGSAAAAQLAGRGLRVAGFERFSLVHDFGSSSGHTRIIRKAYFEDAAYVPLLERSYALWRDLEDASGLALLDLFGVLVAGRPETRTIRGVAHAAARYDIPVEHLDAAQIRTRFPRMQPLDDEVAILEPGAGIVFPERAIAAHLALARDRGADLYEYARVTNVTHAGKMIRIAFEGGEIVEAAHLVVCAGAWTSDLFPQLNLPLTVQRNVQYWFTPHAGTCGPSDLPAFFLERDGLPAPLYGIPDLGDGVKAAFHGFGEITHADRLERAVHPDEIERVRETLAQWIPPAAGGVRSGKACMYTMTPDANFAIGRDPDHANVVIACGFSGHGFKFASAIGESLAQMIVDGEPALELGFLRLERLRRSTAGT